MQNKNLIMLIAVVSACIVLFISLGNILLPFIIGLIGAYIMDRPVSSLNKFKIPRSIGALLVMVLFISFIGILMAIAIPFIRNEISILSKNMPLIIQHIYKIIDPILAFLSLHLPPENIAHLKNQLGSQIGNILYWGINIFVNILSSSLAIANILSLVVITPVVMFYLNKDWKIVMNSIKNLLPQKYRETLVFHALQVDKNLSSYAKGQLAVCLILSIFYSIGLTIIGLKNSILIGFITGILSFIPYVGAIVGFILSVVVHLSNSGDFPITSIAIVFLIIQAIEGNFLTPRLVGGRIGLHPVLILFSLLAGACWFGFFGMAIALPTAAVISSIIKSLRYKKI